MNAPLHKEANASLPQGSNPQRISLAALAICAAAFAQMVPAAAPLARAEAGLSPALRLLRAAPQAATATARGAGLAQEDGRIPVLVLFQSDPDEGDLDACRQAGLDFDRLPSGSPAGFGRLFSGRAAPDRVGILAGLACVEQIDTPWRPSMQIPLDLSAVEAQAAELWEELDGQQRPITGKGVIIADLDTGVDVMHPAFFRPDGGVFDWIDTDGDSVFDPGVDAVDLNANGAADPGEILRFLNGAVYQVPYESGPIHNDSDYDADRDWLYNDANNNAQRDYGVSAGYTETSPCYGEQVFLIQDGNGNGRLDPGERLTGLGTSKVKAVYNPYTDQEWRRGSNLIQCETDDNGHGTGVCGVLAQDSPGYGRALVGLAPDAELVVVNIFSGINLAGSNELAKVMGWAADEGASIFLWEIGSIAWDYADGSSVWEQAVNDAAADGIVQVCPAGNYAAGEKHAAFVLQPGGEKTMRMEVPTSSDPPWYASPRHAYVNITWRGQPGEMDVRIRRPGGAETALGNPSPQGQCANLEDNHHVTYVGDQSYRGTCGIFLWVYKGSINQGGSPLTSGEWSLEIENSSGPLREVHCWVTDDISSWGQGVVWLNDLEDAGTIDVPATADSALAVASYSTRGFGVQAGALSSFSGRGPRIDGDAAVEIAAPGNYDIFSAQSGTMQGGVHATNWSFGGTSAAGPHVAAASALLLQAFPGIGQAGVVQAIRNSAHADNWTGSTPNPEWGSGKLRVRQAWEDLGGTGGDGLAGDANVDGTVNILDLVAMVNHILGEQPLSAQGEANADRDGNGTVNVLDLVRVVQIILEGSPGIVATTPADPLTADQAELGVEWTAAAGLADLEVEWTAAESPAAPLGLRIDNAGGLRAFDLTIRSAVPAGREGPFPVQTGVFGRPAEPSQARGVDFDWRDGPVAIGAESPGWSVWAAPCGEGTVRIVGVRLEAGGAPADGVHESGTASLVLSLPGLARSGWSWMSAAGADRLGNPRPVEGAIVQARGGAEDRLSASARLLVAPSPGRPPIRIGLGGNADGLAGGAGGNPDRVEIFDPSGRRVAVLGTPWDAGEVTWDGRDQSGREAPAGVYFVRSAKHPDACARLILIRF